MPEYLMICIKIQNYFQGQSLTICQKITVVSTYWIVIFSSQTDLFFPINLKLLQNKLNPEIDVWILEKTISILMTSTRPDQGSVQCLNRADIRSLITTSGYQSEGSLVEITPRDPGEDCDWWRVGKIYLYESLY